MGTRSVSSIIKDFTTTQNIVDYNDDIKIISNYTEYNPSSNKLDYIVIEFEVMDRDGSIKHLFKAIKLLKIIKLPDTLKQSMSMMDIHQQILTSFWENNFNFISMIARIEKTGKDRPLGLMQFYGIQGVAKTIHDAKAIADADFAGLISALQGSYRTMEFGYLDKFEADWVREKMTNMKHIQVVRGIPTAKKSSAESSSSKKLGGGDSDQNSEETSEQFAIGLSGHDFIAMTLASPVEYEVLENWLMQTSKKQTGWASIMQGSNSMSAGINLPIMFAANLGASLGSSDGITDSSSQSQSISTSESFGESESYSESRGLSEGYSTSHGINVGYSVSNGITIGSSESYGESAGISHNEGESLSTSYGHSMGTSFGYSESQSVSSSHSIGTSDSVSSSTSLSQSHSVGSSESSSGSISGGYSWSVGLGNSENLSVNGGVEIIGGSLGTGVNNSVGIGGSLSESMSHGKGTSVSDSVSFSQSSGESHGISEGWGSSVSSGIGKNWGSSVSDSISTSGGYSTGDGWSSGISYGKGRSVSQSQSITESYGESVSEGRTQGTSEGVSKGIGFSRGESYGEGESWGRSIGSSSSTSNSSSTGVSTSMGVGASLSVGKTYQFVDAEVQNIVEMLEYQKLRLKSAIHGGTGAFFVDMYIATEDIEGKNAASTAAKFAWYNENAYICPLQVLEFDESTEKHLLYHFNGFSACTEKELDNKNMFECYKYSTILTAPELTAYTHIIRLSDGGIYADIQNIPELAVPANLTGEIYMGKIISGYKWDLQNGYKTKFDYRIESNSLMHALFAAGSRSGKTVAALRFVAEVANYVRRGPKKKRMRILALDPKEDWRQLSRFVEKERFRLYSMGDVNFFPFKFNPLKVPYGVDPEFHLDTLIDVFCRAYGLGIRSVTILLDTLKELYDSVGVFNTTDPTEISKATGKVTMADAYDILMEKKKDYGRDKQEAVEKVLDRLQRFAWNKGILYQLYCQKDGMAIDELLGDDDVIVLESGKLQSNNMTFIFGFITASLYMYAKYCPGNFVSDEQYETLVVVEEANRVLTGQSDDSSGGIQGQSIFEEMLDQAAGLGIFVVSITQKPSMMPSSVIANSGLLFSGRMANVDDIELMLGTQGKEVKFEAREIKTFMPKCPTGWFICKSSRTFDYKESEPILVAVDRLDVQKVTNEELEESAMMNELRQNSIFVDTNSII